MSRLKKPPVDETSESFGALLMHMWLGKDTTNAAAMR